MCNNGPRNIYLCAGKIFRGGINGWKYFTVCRDICYYCCCLDGGASVVIFGLSVFPDELRYVGMEKE